MSLFQKASYEISSFLDIPPSAVSGIYYKVAQSESATEGQTM